ncbi:NAD(P)-dependent oxidoreductase [Membranihabitans maritimus]|uniref:NAD(P)-dependent oxidoreductase n=1 Tax=Membranihabitans maritimus TaxID=2904244 RepID=UPI001F0085C4|nr:NAD(P)-dependent oxidoreductase [Membranihabitans maritimus]
MAKIILIESDTVTTGDLDITQFPIFQNAVVLSTNDTDALFSDHSDVEVLAVNKLQITKAVLDQLPNLKLIQILATGYDNVDLEACKEKGIHVFNVSGYSTHSVAQHVFALLLSITNKVNYHWQMSRDGIWSNESKFCFYAPNIPELNNKIFGIIGLGDIGLATAEIALAFGMDVVTYTRSPEKIKNDRIKPLSLEEVTQISDVISLHVPLTEDTSEMVDTQFLEAMKDSAILINTARGGLINEKGLYDALRAKKIKAAALDVLTSEPPEQDNPLLELTNCIVTSHMAWASIDARSRLLKWASDNISGFINEGKSDNALV